MLGFKFKFSLLLVLFCLLLTYFSFSAPAQSPITIKWYGQSCYKISDGKTTLAIDPYGPQVGYPIRPIQAKWVFISHNHFDHNNVSMVPNARVLRGLTEDGKDWNIFTKQLGPGFTLSTVGVYHDKAQGKERGKNTVSVITVHGIHIVHLGDLGHLLTKKELQDIGPVDVLMIPVGGTFTIDAKEAVAVIQQLHPKVIIPMHYKTRYTVSLPLHPITEFLKASKWPVKTTYGSTLKISGNFPQTPTVYVLTPLSPDHPFSI